MSAPTIESMVPMSVSEGIAAFAPQQGGIEFQTDQPGKVHSWHSHSVTETLVVIEGTMTLEWAEGSPSNVVGRRDVGPGSVIHLPARTIHQSTNQNATCRYLILPEDGRAAATHIFGS